MKLFEEFKLYENMWESTEFVTVFIANEQNEEALLDEVAKFKPAHITVTYDIMDILRSSDLGELTRVYTDVEGLAELQKVCADMPSRMKDKILNTVTLIEKSPLKEAISNYKYYYVVCALEDFGNISEILAAGVRRVDVDWCSRRGYDPAEEAMTDFWDATEIPYSDDWDDDMYDSLMRYVYEIDETTYNTKAGLPKTDAEIIKYVDDSVTEYEE